MIVCLDTGVLMRAIEGTAEKRAAAIAVIRRAEQSEGGLVVASQMSRIECLVRPVRKKNEHRIAQFENFFRDSGIILVDVTQEVLGHALDIRAHKGLKMPDAIAVATAIVARAELIVSADADIHANTFEGLKTEAFPA